MKMYSFASRNSLFSNKEEGRANTLSRLDSVYPLVYLAIMQALKKWTMPHKNWKPAMNRFLI